jgi:PKD repeat protein
LSSRVTRPIEVRPFDPPAASVVVGMSRPRMQESVTFTDLSDGLVHTARWDFGDASPPVTVDYTQPSHKTDRSVKHVYSKDGTYQVTLLVTGLGGESRSVQTVKVEPLPAASKAQFSVRLVDRKSLWTRFANTSRGRIVESVWDFGDESPPVKQASLKDVEHTYAEPGEYEVSLVTRTADGVVSRYIETIIVNRPFPWWSVWGGLTVSICGVVFWRRRTQLRQVQAFACPTGYLSFRRWDDEDASWQEVQVVTDTPSFAFPVNGDGESTDGLCEDGARTAELTKQGNSYTLALKGEDGVAVEESPIDPDNEIRLANYQFKYTT